MGANCCVAARDKPLPPSWSFGWDTRTHIEDIVENPVQFSLQNSRNATSEVKSVADTETDGLSDGENSPEALQASLYRKSLKNEGFENAKYIAADQSTAGNLSPEGACLLKPSLLPTASYLKSSLSILPLSPSSVKVDDPSSSLCGFIRSDPTYSIKARCSPGYQLYGQISDNRVPSLKYLNECSSPEVGRHSVLSNDLSAAGSHGGSSDGWSMRTFSELVASSQRNRWSFDSENCTSLTTKIFGSFVLPATNHYLDLQSCGICPKLLKEKSPRSTHKVGSTNDLPIVAVLVCGHVFHAECLESSTPEIEIYDPPCPVCLDNGEIPTLKPIGELELKGRNKISRVAVADADVHMDSDSHGRKRTGKNSIMVASSRTKNTFGRPFLRRHLFIGSRPVQLSPEKETTRKKSFWAR